MRKRLLAALLILLSLASVNLYAADAESPEDVARRALQALKQDRLDDFAALMHPEALARAKTLLLSIVRAAAKEGAEKEVLGLFRGVETPEQLEKLNDVEFFVSFYGGLTSMLPQMKELLEGAEVRVIGHVSEGKDVAHVVYRISMTSDGAQITKLTVLSVRKTEQGWRMLLSGDIEGVAKMLERRFGGSGPTG